MLFGVILETTAKPGETLIQSIAEKYEGFLTLAKHCVNNEYNLSKMNVPRVAADHVIGNHDGWAFFITIMREKLVNLHESSRISVNSCQIRAPFGVFFTNS